jgi:hypothetical protein
MVTFDKDQGQIDRANFSRVGLGPDLNGTGLAGFIGNLQALGINGVNRFPRDIEQGYLSASLGQRPSQDAPHRSGSANHCDFHGS